MKNVFKGYGRAKRLGTAAIHNWLLSLFQQEVMAVEEEKEGSAESSSEYESEYESEEEETGPRLKPVFVVKWVLINIMCIPNIAWISFYIILYMEHIIVWGWPGSGQTDIIVSAFKLNFTN
jgi:hypothetical protein